MSLYVSIPICRQVPPPGHRHGQQAERVCREADSRPARGVQQQRQEEREAEQGGFGPNTSENLSVYQGEYRQWQVLGSRGVRGIFKGAQKVWKPSDKNNRE